MYQRNAEGYIIDSNHDFGDGWERLTEKEGKRLHRGQHAISLRETLAKATPDVYGNVPVYCSLAHVSRSGMMRHIKLYAAVDGRIVGLTYSAAIVLDMRLASDDGIKVSGCEMDMGFALVNDLAQALDMKLRHEWL